MRQHLHRDLEQIKKELLSLGGRVESAVKHSILALSERREDLANEVIENDHEVDAREVHIEEECLKALALHQPVAQDLRFVITALKVNNDLERIGDHAVSISRRALFLRSQPELVSDLRIELMAERALDMVSSSLRALVTRSPELAKEVLRADDQVDKLHTEHFSKVEDMMEKDSGTVRRAVTYLTISRNLERIADPATNIAEDVIFMASGEVIRHGR